MLHLKVQAPFRTERPGGSTGHFNMSPARVVSLLANLIEQGRFGKMGTLIDAGAGLGYVVCAMQVVSATLGRGFAVIGVEPEGPLWTSQGSILPDVPQARQDALFNADLDSSDTLPLHYCKHHKGKLSRSVSIHLARGHQQGQCGQRCCVLQL